MWPQNNKKVERKYENCSSASPLTLYIQHFPNVFPIAGLVVVILLLNYLKAISLESPPIPIMLLGGWLVAVLLDDAITIDGCVHCVFTIDSCGCNFRGCNYLVIKSRDKISHRQHMLWRA